VSEYLCDECRQPLKPVFEDSFESRRPHFDWLQIDGGISISLEGGYGMFTDMAFNDEGIFMHLCHDCTAVMFHDLSVATGRFHKGLHPYRGDNQCCEWGWK